MDQKRHIWEIEAGFWTMRFGKNCPRVPVRLEIVYGQFEITVNGEKSPETYSADPDDVSDLIALTMMDGSANQHPLVKFHWAERVDQKTYEHLLSMVDYWRKRNPDHPILHPTRPVDLSKIGSLW